MRRQRRCALTSTAGSIRMEKAGETINGQLAAGLIDATRAAALRQIEGKST